MQTQTKPTNGTNGTTRAPAQPPPLNVAPLPAPVHIPSHTPSAQPAPSTPAPAAAPETTPAPAPVVTMTDAPYSWTVTAIDENGFSEMFTVRAVSAAGFYARVQQVKSNLIDLGYKPAPTRGTAASAPASTSEQPPVCGIHKTPMVKRQSQRGSFWACPQKLDTGEFCPYRPKQ